MKQRLGDAVMTVAVGMERMLRPGLLAASAERPKSVLVLHFPPALGCALHETPIFEALKLSSPGRTVAVACAGSTLDVLRHSPFVDHLLEVPDPSDGLVRAVRVLRRKLAGRGLRPDCVLTGAFDRRRAVARLGFLGAGGWRGGFSEDARLSQRPLRYDDSLSVIGNNLRVAELLGWTGGGLEPRVYFSAGEVRHAEELLAPARTGGRPVLVVISQGSGGPEGGWHEDRFAAVIRHAEEVLGYSVVFDGIGKDAVAVESLRATAGGAGISVVGRTRVDQVAAVLALCDMVIAVDTGPMHIARAVGVPMVVLSPAWQTPHSWLPPARPHLRVLRGEYRRDLPDGYRMDEILVDEVIVALEELTARYPAKGEARAARVRASFSEVDRPAGQIES